MVDVCVESARQEIQEVKYPRGASYPSTHSTLAAAAYVRLWAERVIGQQVALLWGLAFYLELWVKGAESKEEICHTEEVDGRKRLWAGLKNGYLRGFHEVDIRLDGRVPGTICVLLASSRHTLSFLTLKSILPHLTQRVVGECLCLRRWTALRCESLGKVEAPSGGGLKTNERVLTLKTFPLKWLSRSEDTKIILEWAWSSNCGLQLNKQNRVEVEEGWRSNNRSFGFSCCQGCQRRSLSQLRHRIDSGLSLERVDWLASS